MTKLKSLKDLEDEYHTIIIEIDSLLSTFPLSSLVNVYESKKGLVSRKKHYEGKLSAIRDFKKLIEEHQNEWEKIHPLLVDKERHDIKHHTHNKKDCFYCFLNKLLGTEGD